MRSKDDRIVISWWEDLSNAVPGDSAAGKPFGGGLHRAVAMDYLLMETLKLACETLRARIVVKACEPGPCPGLAIDNRNNLIPLDLVDASPY